MCVQCIEFPSVPDPPGGLRYCTHCENFIPLAKFPSGPRRHVCKKHMWIASGKNSNQKMLRDPRKRALHRLWSRAYKDAKFFKQPRVAITQAEIGQLLTGGMVSGAGKHGELLTAGGFAIVPRDPTEVLSLSNSAIVPTSARRVLMKRWKGFGKEGFCTLLQCGDASVEAIGEQTLLKLNTPL